MDQIIKALYNVLNTNNDKIYDVLLYGQDIRLITRRFIDLDTFGQITKVFNKTYQCEYARFGNNILLYHNIDLEIAMKIINVINIKTDFNDFTLTCIANRYMNENIDIKLTKTFVNTKSYKYKDLIINVINSTMYDETITEIQFTKSNICNLLELLYMLYPNVHDKICSSLNINFSLKYKNTTGDISILESVKYSGNLKIFCDQTYYEDFESISLKDLYCATVLKIVNDNDETIVDIRPKLKTYNNIHGENTLSLLSSTEFISSSDNNMLTIIYGNGGYYISDKYENIVSYDMFTEDIINKFYNNTTGLAKIPINLKGVSFSKGISLKNGNVVDAKVVRERGRLNVKIINHSNKMLSTVKDFYRQYFNIHSIDYVQDIILMYITKMYIKSDKSILMIYDKFDLPNQYTHVSNIILCGPDDSYIYNSLYNATQCGKICYINYFKYKSFDLKTLTNEIIKIKNIIKLDYIYIDDEDIVNDIEKLKVLNDLNVLNEDGQIILVKRDEVRCVEARCDEARCDEVRRDEVKDIFTNYEMKVDYPLNSTFVSGIMKKNGTERETDIVVMILSKNKGTKQVNNR